MERLTEAEMFCQSCTEKMLDCFMFAHNRKLNWNFDKMVKRISNWQSNVEQSHDRCGQCTSLDLYLLCACITWSWHWDIQVLIYCRRKQKETCTPRGAREALMFGGFCWDRLFFIKALTLHTPLSPVWWNIGHKQRAGRHTDLLLCREWHFDMLNWCLHINS